MSVVVPIVPTFPYPIGSLPVFTNADFLQAILALMPNGRAWPKYPSSNMYQTLAALVPSFARSSAAANGLVADAYPGDTDNLLPEWQASLGLPDPCAGEPANYQQALAQVVARFIGRGGQSVQYFIDYAAQLGFTITITEQIGGFLMGYTAMGVGSFGSDELTNLWTVNSPLFTESLFRMGVNVMGDPLGSSTNNLILECEISAVAPAHNLVLYSYT